jgi:hypothetical protein
MQDFQSFVLGTANRKTHALPKSPYHTIYTIYTMLTYIYTMYIWNRITQSIPIRPRSQQPPSNPQRSLRRPSLALWRYEHLQPQRGCLLRVKGPECRVALGSWLLIIQWSNMMPNNTPCHICSRNGWYKQSIVGGLLVYLPVLSAFFLHLGR